MRAFVDRCIRRGRKHPRAPRPGAGRRRGAGAGQCGGYERDRHLRHGRLHEGLRRAPFSAGDSESMTGVVERVGTGVETLREGDESTASSASRSWAKGRWPTSSPSGSAASPTSRARSPGRGRRRRALGAHSRSGGRGRRAPSGAIRSCCSAGQAASAATPRSLPLSAVSVIALTRPEFTVYAQSMGAAAGRGYTVEDPVEELRTRYPDGVDAVIDPSLSLTCRRVRHPS